MYMCSLSSYVFWSILCCVSCYFSIIFFFVFLNSNSSPLYYSLSLRKSVPAYLYSVLVCISILLILDYVFLLFLSVLSSLSFFFFLIRLLFLTLRILLPPLFSFCLLLTPSFFFFFLFSDHLHLLPSPPPLSSHLVSLALSYPYTLFSFFSFLSSFTA